MKVKARKLLSLLLTLAMVAGMFVLPASAAQTTTTIDFATATEGSKLSGTATFGSPTSTYFTAHYDGSSSIASKQCTFGTEEGSYKGTKYLQFNGASNKSDGSRVITFKPTEGFTLTVWYSQSKDNNSAVVKLWKGTNQTGTEVTCESESTTTTSASSGGIVVFKVPSVEADATYAIGSTGEKARFYKIEVVEGTAGPAVTEYDLKVDSSVSADATVKFQVDGKEVTKAAAGKEVTVVATAPSGQAVDTITSSDVTIANGKFTMPAKAVTVNVTFKTAGDADVVANVKTIVESKLKEWLGNDLQNGTLAHGSEPATVALAISKIKEKLGVNDSGFIGEYTAQVTVAVPGDAEKWTAAEDGTETNVSGTPGKFEYTVTLKKGDVTDTVTGKVTVTVTPYTVTREMVDAAISAANTAMKPYGVGEASEVFAGKKIVSTDVMNALVEKLRAAAKESYASKDMKPVTAEQSLKNDAAIKALNEAVETFKSAVAGASETGTKTGTEGYVLRAREVATTVESDSTNWEVDTSDDSGDRFKFKGSEAMFAGTQKAGKGYFKLVFKNGTGRVERNKSAVFTDGFEGEARINFNTAKTETSNYIEFTVGADATADLKVHWVSNGQTLQLTDANGAVSGQTGLLTDVNNVANITTWKGLKAGTYQLGASKGQYFFRVEVIEHAPEAAVIDKISIASNKTVKYGDSNFTEVPTVTMTDGSKFNGTISYESSKTDVATVNASTGEVTIKGVGTTTITATANDGKTTKAARYTVTVAQAEPAVTLSAIRTSLQGDDTVRTFKLTVTAPAYVAASDITVTGTVDGTSDTVTTTKNGNVYQVLLPDETKDYTFTAKVAASTNYKAAASNEVYVAVTKQGEVKKTYKIECDTAVITFPEGNPSTLDKVEYRSNVTATAKPAPAGQVFDKWEVTGLTLTADELKANPLVFQMPGNNVTLKATYKAKPVDPDDPNQPVAVTGVSLNTNTLELIAGEDATLIASVQPGKATNKNVTWASSDDAVATVDATGKVVAVAAGTAKITVTTTDGGKTAICDVTVTAASSGPVTTTKILDAMDLDVVTKDDNKNLNGEKWGTNDFITVCSVEAGKPFVPAVAETSFDGKTWTKTITLGGAFSYNKGNPKAGLKFETAGNATLKVWWANANNTEARNLALYDASGNQIVASDASAEGHFAAQDVFEYQLTTAGTYYLGSNKSSVNIYRVELSETTSSGPVSVTGVSLDKATASIVEGETETLVATIAPTNATNKKLTWSTSDFAVATVADGTITAVKAGTATITVTTANGKTASCTVTVTASSTPDTPSGGGSGSNVPSSGGGTTVKNEDGSKTTTKTNKATGTVTETTTWPNGDKQVVVTEKDGTVTETITKKDGSKTETVTKPDGSTTTAVTDTKGIKTETAVTASGETSAKVTLPSRVDKAVVTIPVKDATDGTVAVIVDAKGNETVIKTAVADETGLKLLVTGNVSVKIKDNAKKFQDIDDGYWAKGAVDFVSSREIFKGTTDVTFSPLDLVNRGMMATVLFRLADAKAEGDNAFFDVPDGTWYTDAVTWANRSGVVTGYADGTFGPVDAVTREQMAAMLFRYAKVMGMDVTAKGDMSKFSDANDVSSWASEAMTWCVGVGLINGVADPATGTTLSPAKTASRAEVATIMQRMVKLMMQ